VVSWLCALFSRSQPLSKLYSVGFCLIGPDEDIIYLLLYILYCIGFFSNDYLVITLLTYAFSNIFIEK